MNKSRLPDRRKFLGDVTAFSVMGAIGAGQLLFSCKPGREKYVPPVFLERAPDGPVLKAGII